MVTAFYKLIHLLSEIHVAKVKTKVLENESSNQWYNCFSLQ